MWTQLANTNIIRRFLLGKPITILVSEFRGPPAMYKYDYIDNSDR